MASQKDSKIKGFTGQKNTKQDWIYHSFYEWGSGGRKFESCHPDDEKASKIKGFAAFGEALDSFWNYVFGNLLRIC